MGSAPRVKGREAHLQTLLNGMLKADIELRSKGQGFNPNSPDFTPMVASVRRDNGILAMDFDLFAVASGTWRMPFLSGPTMHQRISIWPSWSGSPRARPKSGRMRLAIWQPQSSSMPTAARSRRLISNTPWHSSSRAIRGARVRFRAN